MLLFLNTRVFLCLDLNGIFIFDFTMQGEKRPKTHKNAVFSEF